jgi:hypothetical protein
MSQRPTRCAQYPRACLGCLDFTRTIPRFDRVRVSFGVLDSLQSILFCTRVLLDALVQRLQQCSARPNNGNRAFTAAGNVCPDLIVTLGKRCLSDLLVYLKFSKLCEFRFLIRIELLRFRVHEILQRHWFLDRTKSSYVFLIALEF